MHKRLVEVFAVAVVLGIVIFALTSYSKDKQLMVEAEPGSMERVAQDEPSQIPLQPTESTAQDVLYEGPQIAESGPDGFLYLDSEFKISFRVPESYRVSPNHGSWTRKAMEEEGLRDSNWACQLLAYVAVADMGYSRYKGPALDIRACVDRGVNSFEDIISRQAEIFRGSTLVARDIEINGKTFVEFTSPGQEGRGLQTFHDGVLFSIVIMDERIDAKRLWSIIKTVRFD